MGREWMCAERRMLSVCVSGAYGGYFHREDAVGNVSTEA